MLTLFLCLDCWTTSKKNKDRKIPAFVTNFLLIREFHLVFQRYGYYNSGILENKAGFLKNKLDKN